MRFKKTYLAARKQFVIKIVMKIIPLILQVLKLNLPAKTYNLKHRKRERRYLYLYTFMINLSKFIMIKTIF